MSPEVIARALGGARRAGRGWVACCPAHEDRNPSLSVADGEGGKLLVHCHAGCDQTRVIAALRVRGLWQHDSMRDARHIRPQPKRTATDLPNRNDGKRTKAALRIWQTAAPGSGSPVETYLRSRGIGMAVPPTLRFHPGLKHPSGGIWPAMVALVTRGSDDVPLAIHRTFLSRDGNGKAPVAPQKMMLGPCHGGAVRLAPSCDLLMVGEGVETCLAAMQATWRPTWAALSTSGLRILDLPAEAREVIVLADGDDPGAAAARDAALRWKREGRRIRIARPPQGLDFNDLLLGRAPRVVEGAA